MGGGGGGGLAYLLLEKQVDGVILYHFLKNNHVSEMNFEATFVFPNTKVLVYILRRYDVMMTSSCEI